MLCATQSCTFNLKIPCSVHNDHSLFKGNLFILYYCFILMNFIFIFYLQSAKKSIKPFNREKVKIDKPQKQDAQYFQEISQSKQMCDFEMQFPSRLLAEVEPKEPKISEVGQQAVDAHSGNVCSLSGKNEEGGEPSNASSDWSSTVLGMESPRMSQGKLGTGRTLDFGKLGGSYYICTSKSWIASIFFLTTLQKQHFVCVCALPGLRRVRQS